eukprot:TRINITY_DN1710_c0_g1_i1.p1 TRINITY_DN1710_c0_g1~~TRINITY_DN1710_c0_g1_i1.p1  ORF type:complete len:121 (-),score=48.83 TRINITY_DN1710_c0_g1_i1:39-401(-)
MDEFDSVIDVERRITEPLVAAAFDVGAEQGAAQGRALGHKHGFALGSELAQYEAFVRVMRHRGGLRERATRTIDKLDARLSSFEDARAAAGEIESIRSLYTQAAAQCGVHKRKEPIELSF